MVDVAGTRVLDPHSMICTLVSMQFTYAVHTKTSPWIPVFHRADFEEWLAVALE